MNAQRGLTRFGRPPARRLGLAAVAASLLSLLALLASLQYRWLGQLSQAELTRLRAGAHARAVEFGEHFDRELTRAFLWLRLDPIMMEAPDGEMFAKRYDRWLGEAPYARMVQGVLLLEPGPGGRSRSLRFDPDRRAFVPDRWPESLEDLRDPAAESGHARERVRSVFLDPIREDVPALIFPVPRLELRPPAEGTHSDGAFPIRYGVIVLDGTYLKEELIPALAERHLSSGEGLDYSVEIARRNEPASVFYRHGSPRQGKNPAPGDASVELFSLRLVDANRDLLVGADFGSEAGIMLSRRGAAVRLGRRAAGIRATGVVHTFNVVMPPRLAAPPPSGGRWRLTLTHRVGSLAQVVGGARRRNMAVSFGILVILGLSVVVIAVATRRAERLARAQLEFVAGVSHELGTPLAVICTAGANLADGLFGGGEPVRRYGALVRDEGTRLREIVEQVLEFSTPEASAAQRDPLDLAVVVEGALSSCRTEIVERGFEVRREIAPVLPIVRGDAAMLSRAVQNLVRNALKYSGPCRWLAVQVAAEPDRRSTHVTVTVRDGGLGIEPADIHRIFEAFYRGREALARQIHGTGLGLSLVRRIVEEHGGSVSVESEPGRGSAFTIRLPASGG